MDHDDNGDDDHDTNNDDDDDDIKCTRYHGLPPENKLRCQSSQNKTCRLSNLVC